MPTRSGCFRALPWFLGAALTGAIPPAHAQSVAVEGNGLAQAVECDGGDAVVRGNSNQLAMHGNCRSVRVEGNNNRLRVQLAPDAVVTVRGNGNDVRYRVAGAAQVDQEGKGNDVTADNGRPLLPPPAVVAQPAAPAPIVPAGALALREENMRRDISCAGRDVLVEGNGDEYTLHGGCRSLTVRGEGVVIRAEMQPASRITVQGNGDSVNWTLRGDGAEPTFSVDGENSRVERAESGPAPHYAATPRPYASRMIALPADQAQSALAPTSAPLPPPVPVPAPVPAAAPDMVASSASPVSVPMPAPKPTAKADAKPEPKPDAKPGHAGKLVLRGDHEARDLDCAGRDVTVDGAFGLIVLRGGCASVMVKGDYNKIQAELAPGAGVTIDGKTSNVAYVASGANTGDEKVAETVHGQDSHIRQIPRLGAISPAGQAEDAGKLPPAKPASQGEAVTQPLPAAATTPDTTAGQATKPADAKSTNPTQPLK